jgi:Na+-driven multidrug efflux pump
LASCFAGVQRTAGRATQACGSYFTYTLFDIVIFLTTSISALLFVKQYGVVGAATSVSIGFAVGLFITLVHTYSFLDRSGTKTFSEEETIAHHSQ